MHAPESRFGGKGGGNWDPALSPALTTAPRRARQDGQAVRVIRQDVRRCDQRWSSSAVTATYNIRAALVVTGLARRVDLGAAEVCQAWTKEPLRRDTYHEVVDAR
jgi:hypothetical protein